MEDGISHVSAAEISLDSSSDTQTSVTGKFTMQIDCDGLLKPSNDDPNILTTKTGDESASYFHLDTLLDVPIIHVIKIKCIHACGALRLEEVNHCITALWAVGDWFIDEYQRRGRSAQCEKTMSDARDRDLLQPDAVITVFVD